MNRLKASAERKNPDKATVEAYKRAKEYVESKNAEYGTREENARGALLRARNLYDQLSGGMLDKLETPPPASSAKEKGASSMNNYWNKPQ